MHIEELKPGVSQISASTDWPRHHIGVLGSMHGNEPCGAHEDPDLADKAYKIALSFLRATGAIDDGQETRSNEMKTVHVVETITKPSEYFVFGSPWTGFQQLEPGALVGRDRVTDIRTSRRCYAVLPNEGVEVGDDVIYLVVDT